MLPSKHDENRCFFYDANCRRQRIVNIAQQVLLGQVEILEGALSLEELALQIDREENTSCLVSYPEEFNIFAVIASDADRFPTGEARKYWNPSKLAERDKEKDDHEQFYKEEAFAACRRLISKYQNDGES